jgi:hypothetical protein
MRVSARWAEVHQIPGSHLTKPDRAASSCWEMIAFLHTNSSCIPADIDSTVYSHASTFTVGHLVCIVVLSCHIEAPLMQQGYKLVLSHRLYPTQLYSDI